MNLESPDIEAFLQVQTAIEHVLDGESKYAVAKSTAISRRTLSRIVSGGSAVAGDNDSPPRAK